MRTSLFAPLALSALFGVAACGDSPTAASSAPRQDTGPPSAPAPPLTREQLLNDPLTLALVASLPVQERNPHGSPGWMTMAGPIAIETDDSLVTAATLELILQAADALGSGSAGGS